MKDEIQQERIRAVQRFLNDEKPESICASLNCCRRCLIFIDKFRSRKVTPSNTTASL